MAEDMDDLFHHMHGMDENKFVKHNDTDFDSFKSFQERLNARFERHEQEKKKRERKANLARWAELLPPRWASASLPEIEAPNKEAAELIVAECGKSESPSFWLAGPSDSGKTYMAYATIRRFIGMGWTSPGHVKILSEEALMGFAAGGFEGQNRFNELLKPHYTTYLIDGVGKRPTLTQKEQQLWEQLIDHIYSKSLTLIITSDKESDSFTALLSDSAETKLNHLVDGKIIKLKKRGSTASHKAKNGKEPEKESGKYGLWKD